MRDLDRLPPHQRIVVGSILLTAAVVGQLAVIVASGCLIYLIAPWTLRAIAAWQHNQLELWLKCEVIGLLGPFLEWLGCACSCG